MSGDDQSRLCAQCNKHVHNLSAFPPHALHRFIEERDGTECIAYIVREDGNMITASRWPRLAKIAARVRLGSLWLLAFLLPSLFAGCAQRAANSYNGMMKGTPLPGKPAAPQHRTAHHAPDGNMVLGEAPNVKPTMSVGRVKISRER